MVRLIACILALCVIARPLLAEAPATQPAQDDPQAQRLQALLNDLADRDDDARERARIELMGMSRSDLAVFARVVERSHPLLPAQRLVLREIIMHAYLAADAYPADREVGFLGVQLGEATLDGEADGDAQGVLITGRIVGFCGYRMLRTGDVILRLMEQPAIPLRSHAHLAAAIRTFPAGQTVELEVLRQGRLVRVPVRLDARPLELDQVLDLDHFQWRRDDRFHDYWKRTFAPLLADGVS